MWGSTAPIQKAQISDSKTAPQQYLNHPEHSQNPYEILPEHELTGWNHRLHKETHKSQQKQPRRINTLEAFIIEKTRRT